MNPVAEDILMHYGIKDRLEGLDLDSENVLAHYGKKRRSGRYPWGSGENPYQHGGDFLARVNELKKSGITSEKDLADAMKMTTTDLRMQIRVANHQRRELEADRARSLRDDGKSLNEIASIMGYKNDSSIRSLLNENTAINKNRAKVTADILKKELAEKDMLDVGVGVERELGVSQNTLKEALFILETEGYNVYGVGIPQVTNKGKQTITTVLADKDKEYKDAYNYGEIKSVGNYHSDDAGTSFVKLERPSSLDSSRVEVRYGDKGGSEKDGVIEIRRGVADLDLGNSHYAQVRIMVDDSYYLKGMAMYSDDMPPGKDIVFNTNKKTGTPMMEGKKGVLKPIKHDDPNNPFGAAIKANGQSWYTDKDGKKKLSPINKLKEEGDWDTMSKNLSSQFLSKQPLDLIRKQLNLTYRDSAAELDEIRSLTNPTLKKKLLLDYADQCEGAAVHLKAASLPRQTTRVILPITSMRETEVYAPTYKNGEKLALVRYPHGGTFEIPILTVNNKNKSARSILGENLKDAIGIHPKVAERLSGADFDGDQVIAIPTGNQVKIKSTRPLKGLENFNPKDEYPETPGMKYMTKANTQRQMGIVSNLITDMTLRSATEDEMVRAIKHSMVVIDAEKHRLNYRKSEKDNDIASLKKKYQGYKDPVTGKDVGGASTLLSRRKQDVLVPERRGSGIIDKETGKVSYKTSGRTYVDDKGNVVPATQKSKLLLETDDVRSLSSGTAQENAYANYANQMKSLANTARKLAMATPNAKTSPSAKKKYEKEIESLDAKLNVAAMNAPRERRAQAIANSKIKAMVQDNPDLSSKENAKELKKQKQIAITEARASIGASGKESKIKITDSEWEAIQSGGVSSSKQSQIFRYTDADALKQRALPKTTTALSTAKQNKVKAMQRSGFTIAEIAESLGVSTSTVSKYL